MKSTGKRNFGIVFKELRKKHKYSIKKLAPELNINYSYLSKLENGHTSPSEDFIERVASLFNYDKEELMISAGKIPEDVLMIIRDNPREVVTFLRRAFGDRRGKSTE